MKKSAKIYILVLVWLSAMVQFFINEKVEAGQQVAEAFSRTDIMHYDSRLVVEGIYGHSNYNDEKICNILGNIMKEIAPTEQTFLYKSSNEDIWYAMYGDVDLDITISFVKAAEGENSLLKTEINIRNTESNTEENERQPVDIWKERLCTLYEQLGMEAETRITLSGQYHGRLNNAEKAICRQSIEDSLDKNDAQVAFAYHYDTDVTNVEVTLK
ncbi:MAG: hypothetical protein J6L77_11620 [Coprococcus sp.]|nr:hypothetical protein [Coprococcus sp.]